MSRNMWRDNEAAAGRIESERPGEKIISEIMRTEAIILKKIPIREYDLLVVCYTRHAGKQTYVAKSVRRSCSKQASHLDLLNYVDFTSVQPKNSGKDLISNGHPIITQAYSLKTFHNLKSRLPAMAAAFFLLECLNKLVFEGQADDQLWNFLENKVEELDRLANQRGVRWPAVIETTRKELLSTLGYETGASVEDLAGSQFKSLQFCRNMIK